MSTYFCRLQFNKMCHNSYITLDIKNPSRTLKEGSMWNILTKFHSIWTIGSVANDEKVTVNLFKALTVFETLASYKGPVGASKDTKNMAVGEMVFE